TLAKIWAEINQKLETAISQDADYLQSELFECKLENAVTVIESLNRIREIRDKLAMNDNPLTHRQLIFHIFYGLPTTAEWKTWIRITKGTLSSLTAQSGYTELKDLLVSYEAELRREQSLMPGQALFTKGKRNNYNGNSNKRNNNYNNQNQRQQKSTSSFTGNCHHCGKKGHKMTDRWKGI